MRLHLEGMWVAFAVAAAFTVAFVARVTPGARRTRGGARPRARPRRAERAAGVAGHARRRRRPRAGDAARHHRHRGQGVGARPGRRRCLDRRGRCTLDPGRRSTVAAHILDRMAADAGEAPADAGTVVAVRTMVEASLTGLSGAERVRVVADRRAAESMAQAPAARGHAVVARAGEECPRCHVGGRRPSSCAADVDHARVEVEVTEAGPGMPREVLARARRAVLHHQGARAGDGARSVRHSHRVERLGGRLAFDSTPGQGHARARSPCRGGGTRDRQMRPSILIVDDDEPFRQRLVRAFADRGLRRASSAADYDGGHGDRRAPSRPSSPWSTLKMPGRSGLELAHDLLASIRPRSVVLLTGYGSIATRRRRDARRLRLVPAQARRRRRHPRRVLRRAGGPGLPRTPSDFRPPASLERAEVGAHPARPPDCAANVSEAARRLGLHRRSLQRILGKHPPSR